MAYVTVPKDLTHVKSKFYYPFSQKYSIFKMPQKIPTHSIF